MTERARLMIVDDDPLVRAGLRLILGGAPDLEIVAEATDGDEVLDLAATHHPHLVLMDIRMPRVDGLAATRALLATDAPPSVVVLTTFDSDEMVLDALRLGAVGFLLKDTPPDRLVAAVRTALAGEPTLSPAVAAQVIRTATSGQDGRRREAQSALSGLTERELEVARLVGLGLSNAEIGERLYLSLPTVKTHMSRLLDKLGAGNRVQLALLVHDAGLDDDR